MERQGPRVIKVEAEDAYFVAEMDHRYKAQVLLFVGQHSPLGSQVLSPIPAHASHIVEVTPSIPTSR